MPLYIVPTPIGNLKDITYRAVEVLNKADVILAEDTRTSSKLLNHYLIDGKLQSFHMHNEHKKLEGILKLLESGSLIALISDAGTPGISDPGFLLVRELIGKGVGGVWLPGATCLISARVEGGFPCDRFVFEGFLPNKKGRLTRLEFLANESRTIILYESPHRILKTLNQFLLYFKEERKISVVRELSKKFETQFRGTIREAIEYFNINKPRGEFVISISSDSHK